MQLMLEEQQIALIEGVKESKQEIQFLRTDKRIGAIQYDVAKVSRSSVSLGSVTFSYVRLMLDDNLLVRLP